MRQISGKSNDTLEARDTRCIATDELCWTAGIVILGHASSRPAAGRAHSRLANFRATPYGAKIAALLRLREFPKLQYLRSLEIRNVLRGRSSAAFMHGLLAFAERDILMARCQKMNCGALGNVALATFPLLHSNTFRISFTDSTDREASARRRSRWGACRHRN